MASGRWERLKGRIAPTTVQQLLDHTEEIDQQIEQVLVGLYNDMTAHRARVAEVSSKLEEAGKFSQTIRELVRTTSVLETRFTKVEDSLSSLSASHSSMQNQLRRIYLVVAVNCLVVISAIVALGIS